MLSSSLPTVLILGIGNVLWADEGFGVRAVECLQREYEFVGNVQVMDGGTQGLYLVQHIREADIVVVFDAVDYGLPGGTLKLVEGEAVPNFLGAKKVSLHQTGFQEVLALAQMMGDYPQHLLLVGVQPVVLEDFGGSLHPQVKAQIPAAHKAALDFLSQHGVHGQRRSQPLIADVVAQGAISDMNLYERQRPTAEVACRDGDGRVLNSAAFQVRYQPVDVEGISVALDQHLDPYRKASD